MRHWTGLKPGGGRTACGIVKAAVNSIYGGLVFRRGKFGELMKDSLKKMCPECVRLYKIEAKRPPFLMPVKMRPKCRYIGTMYRVKQVGQCRKFAMEGSEPSRCQWHKDMK